jgi:hypothetical protein
MRQTTVLCASRPLRRLGSARARHQENGSPPPEQANADPNERQAKKRFGQHRLIHQVISLGTSAEGFHLQFVNLLAKVANYLRAKVALGRIEKRRSCRLG